MVTELHNENSVSIIVNSACFYSKPSEFGHFQLNPSEIWHLVSGDLVNNAQILRVLHRTSLFFLFQNYLANIQCVLYTGASNTQKNSVLHLQNYLAAISVKGRR